MIVFVLMKKGLFKELRDFVVQDNEYYKNNLTSIWSQNAHLLRLSCLIYLGVLLIYTITVAIQGKSILLFNLYCVYDVLHIILCVVVFMQPMDEKINLKSTHILVTVFEILFLSFFIVEGVFPFPDTHSMYIPIAMFLVVVVFSHKIGVVFAMIFISMSAYVFLSYSFKTQSAFSNDLNIAGATTLSSLICYFISAGLRHKEREAVKKLKDQMASDLLTGVLNRNEMEKQTESYIETSKGADALIIIDIDDFKRFNDLYGHEVGDTVLKKTAESLKEVFKGNPLIGRFGGDEFIVMMSINDGGKGAVIQKIDEFADKLAHYTYPDMEEKITCSFGIAINDNRKVGYHALFVKADKALYVAKAEGKNCYSFSKY